MKKICKKCGQSKALDEFYKSKLSRCKACVKADHKAYRATEAGKASVAASRKRWDKNNPDHKKRWAKENASKVRKAGREWARRNPEASKRWQVENPEKAAKAKANWRKGNPKKYRAHIAINNAVKLGKVQKPSTCQSCKKDIPSRRLQAHHDDYSKPLDVRWLCAPCHNQWHIQNGPGANGGD